MKLRLYLDEDSMRQPVVHALRLRNVDVITPLEAGTVGYSDMKQLQFATAASRVLYSYNCVDFCRLHAELLAGGGHHAGIVVTQQTRFSIGEQLRRILRIVSAVSAEDMRDRLEFLNHWS